MTPLLNLRQLLWRWLLLAVAALVALTICLPALTAFATSAEPGGDVVAPIVVVGDPSTVTITPVQWTLITGLVLPFILAIVVKNARSPRAKAVIAIVVAAAAALVERSQLADGSAMISSGALLDCLYVYGPQLLTYLGLWRHFEINQKLAPNFGI